MKNKIEEFLKSNETELSLPFIPLEIYEVLFIGLGYNLWGKYYSEGDFSFEYKYDDRLYSIVLTGSLYNGNFKLIKE